MTSIRRVVAWLRSWWVDSVPAGWGEDSPQEPEQPPPLEVRTRLGPEHDLSFFAEQEGEYPDRYALKSIHWSVETKLLTASSKNMLAAVRLALEGVSGDLMIRAIALKAAYLLARGRWLSAAIEDKPKETELPVLAIFGDLVRLETGGGAVAFAIGDQSGRWPLWWELDGFAAAARPQVIFSLAPALLKALAEYAIAAGQESITFGLNPDPDPKRVGTMHADGPVPPRFDREGIRWVCGRAFGIIMAYQTPDRDTARIRGERQEGFSTVTRAEG